MAKIIKKSLKKMKTQTTLNKIGLDSNSNSNRNKFRSSPPKIIIVKIKYLIEIIIVIMVLINPLFNKILTLMNLKENPLKSFNQIEATKEPRIDRKIGKKKMK
jgi:hypothetical protein